MVKTVVARHPRPVSFCHRSSAQQDPLKCEFDKVRNWQWKAVGMIRQVECQTRVLIRACSVLRTVNEACLSTSVDGRLELVNRDIMNK